MPAMAPAPAEAEARFEALLQQYGALIAWAVRRAAGSAADHDTEDIRQNVVVALWTQLKRGRTITHPTSYLHTIAVRETVRAMARVRAQSGEPLGDDIGAAAGDPLDDLTRREHREAIRAAVTALSRDRRRAVQGHLAGFSVRELMDLYGWSYQRARNLVARGVADLRAALCERAPGESGTGYLPDAVSASQARRAAGPSLAHSRSSAW